MFNIVWSQVGLRLPVLQQSSPSHCLIWIEMFCATAITHTNPGILHGEWITFQFGFVFRKNCFQNCALATLLTFVAKCNARHSGSPFSEILIVVHEQL